MSMHADRNVLQNRLFAQLSRMFGDEVPLYDKSILVNRACNRAVCDLLGRRHLGFTITDEQLDRTSGERHGAIRIGTPEEYRWVTRLFGVFGMEPHNFYNMTDVGAKSQPVIATAFRSTIDPEHRIFCSLLMTDWFDAETKGRIEALLSRRHVFSERAKRLIERCEVDGGLDDADADSLIDECTGHIFRWTGTATDHALYTHLCQAGFKIAADIACFRTHHLNHLTPNTFWMDLYTAAMRLCLGIIDAPSFRARATVVLTRLLAVADGDWLRLQFRHLTPEMIDAFGVGDVTPEWISERAGLLTRRLQQADLDLGSLKHSGFKDFTEGPPQDTPVLLRQDAYRALTEPVRFEEADGSVVDGAHTARFGEIEQRFYAATAKGRELYDACLAEAERARAEDPGLAQRDPEASEREYARPFARFPKTLPALLRAGLVFGRFRATDEGRAATGGVTTADLRTLLEQGLVAADGVRYEDFLPVSAAGIFASNLNQYGTQSTASTKPTYTREVLERVMGRPIIDAHAVYAGIEAQSILGALDELGARARLDRAERARLDSLVASAGTALRAQSHPAAVE